MRKYLSILIVAVLAFAGMTMMSSASAATASPVNVRANYYYVSPTESVSETTRDDPTPDNPYAESVCAPQQCGQIVTQTKTQLLFFKTKVVVLKKVAGETLVDGTYYYADDAGHYKGGPWDGTAIPVTSKLRVGNKFVTVTLRSAYAELYNPALPLKPTP